MQDISGYENATVSLNSKVIPNTYSLFPQEVIENPLHPRSLLLSFAIYSSQSQTPCARMRNKGGQNRLPSHSLQEDGVQTEVDSPPVSSLILSHFGELLKLKIIQPSCSTRNCTFLGTSDLKKQTNRTRKKHRQLLAGEMLRSAVPSGRGTARCLHGGTRAQGKYTPMDTCHARLEAEAVSDRSWDWGDSVQGPAHAPYRELTQKPHKNTFLASTKTQQPKYRLNSSLTASTPQPQTKLILFC